MTTGEKIAALRREHKLSQEALGEKLARSLPELLAMNVDDAAPPTRPSRRWTI